MTNTTNPVQTPITAPVLLTTPSEVRNVFLQGVLSAKA